MKKYLSVFLVIILLLVSILNTYAVEAPDINTIETHTNEQYGFSYSKAEDSSGRIIRTYKKGNSALLQSESTPSSFTSDNDSKKYEYTKAVLSELGVNASTIETFSNESLEKYASAKSIQSIVSYTKTDANGITTIISEEAALEEVSLASPVDPNFPTDFYGDASYPFYRYNLTDTYMKLTLIISEYGNGYFHYSVDAEWLLMPFFRGYDAVGISVMNSAIVNNTRAGWYSYQMFTTYPYDRTTITNHFDDDDFQNCTNGNWRGSGVVYKLNPDYIGNTNSITFSTYIVHYEFQAVVTSPQEESYFEVTASHEHAIQIINIAPSLQLSTSGSSASLNFTVEASTQTRVLEIPTPIHYTP